MSDTKSSYKWKKNNACNATYKVLEGDSFLDQFEDSEISFNSAPSVKLKKLLYFPQTTANSQIIDALSLDIARKFIKYIMKIFTVEKEDTDDTSQAIIISIAKVFADGEKTIKDLAEIVDKKIKFPDE